MKHLKPFNEAVVNYADIDKKNPPVITDSIGLTSGFAIGERVYFSYPNVMIPAVVRTITFTNGKVRYSLRLTGIDFFNDEENQGANEGDPYTTIHNVDSVFVQAYPNPDGTKNIIDLEFDNYS